MQWKAWHKRVLSFTVAKVTLGDPGTRSSPWDRYCQCPIRALICTRNLRTNAIQKKSPRRSLRPRANSPRHELKRSSRRQNACPNGDRPEARYSAAANAEAIHSRSRAYAQTLKGLCNQPFRSLSGVKMCNEPSRFATHSRPCLIRIVRVFVLCL